MRHPQEANRSADKAIQHTDAILLVQSFENKVFHVWPDVGCQRKCREVRNKDPHEMLEATPQTPQALVDIELQHHLQLGHGIPWHTSQKKRMLAPLGGPVIRLSEWLRVGFEDFFIAGGKDLAELEATLEEFWHRYRFVEDSMPENPRRTLPVMLHGDEERGQVKRHLMVVSYQPLISCYGDNHLNSKGPLGLNVSCVS